MWRAGGVCMCVLACVILFLCCVHMCVGGCVVYLCVSLCVQMSGWISACMGMCFCVSLWVCVYTRHLFALPGLILIIHGLNLTFQHCPKLQTGKRSWKLWQKSILSFPLLCSLEFSTWPFSLRPKRELFDLWHYESVSAENFIQSSKV